jgi:hypothetical protein
MWYPQPGHQLAAFEADWCEDLFYGGERGGGKSDFQLGWQEDGALRYGQAHRGILFRKTYAELEELQSRAMEIFPGEGAIYKTQPSADYPFSNSWYWPNGASTKMRFIEAEKDYGRYHGHSYTRIGFDEVTEYATQAPLIKMYSTLRSPFGVPCSVRSTGNPGGAGHIWVKSRYIDRAPPMTPYLDVDDGMTRMFVPSALADNVILVKQDPKYRSRIIAATNGNEALRKAWLEGDWNIVAGAFFDCWNSKLHVVKPFSIPEEWGRIRSGDWGSARPFSFGWWAVATDPYTLESGLVIPRGAMVRYREWYGCKDPINEPNVGLKLTAEDVGAYILELEKNDPKINDAVLDPAAFTQDGGPSIVERIVKGARSQIWFRRADNKRVAKAGAMGGWDQVRARMLGDSDGPAIYCFDTCTDSIRTIPLLQHDKLKLEDIDTEMEDHAADEWRYACMSRPYVRKSAEESKPRFLHQMTANDVFWPKNKAGKMQNDRI